MSDKKRCKNSFHNTKQWDILFHFITSVHNLVRSVNINKRFTAHQTMKTCDIKIMKSIIEQWFKLSEDIAIMIASKRLKKCKVT